MVATTKLNAAQALKASRPAILRSAQPSALHPKLTRLRLVNTWRYKANYTFDMRCRRVPLFDVACHYFRPCIGQLANWTMLRLCW